MFYVVLLNDEGVCKTVFKAHVEQLCWDFVYSRLMNVSQKVKKESLYLHVIDSEGTFYEPSIEVRSMQRFVKLMTQEAA